MNINIYIDQMINSTSGVLFLSIREHAYLDPGSGSFILQLIIATLLGGLLVLRGYWSKILSFFGNIFRKKQDKDVE